jgi:branched-chain amino acid transport system ATP-binding protein
MALLELEKVSKAFGGVRAVREVSLSVQEGELLGVMGPNGSGKTTLFNLITGTLTPDAGRIRLRGEEITRLSPHRICAKGVARTFQLVRPFLGLSAIENVVVGGLYGRRRIGTRAAWAEGERLLEFVGLAGKARVLASQLTVMDRKRLELARALATSPRLLLLDEFMAGLNPAETESAMRLIKELQREGLTLVMVEHIVWALLDLSQRIVVLSAGEKIADGPPAAIASDSTVIDVYLGSGQGA